MKSTSKQKGAGPGMHPQSLPSPAGSRAEPLAAVMFATAFSISLYLAWQSMAGNAIPGCGPQSGCDRILASRWSVVGGVPVSLLGVVTFGVLLLSVLLGPPRRSWRHRLERGMSLLVLTGALWFTVVQAFLLKAFCPWCCAVHLVAVAGVLALWHERRRTASSFVARRFKFAEFALPMATVAGLALFQNASSDPERIQERNLDQVLVSDAGKLSLHRGQLALDPAELPVIGLPQAELSAVALTDFTCPHCQELHRTLAQLSADRPGRFNVVLLPAAYEPEAKELHRIMLSLWRIAPGHYRQVADEIAGGSLNSEPKDVLATLQQKLDGRFYELAWPHAAWVEETMQLGQRLMELNGREAGASTLPQLVIGDRVLTGAPHLETLAGIIDLTAKPAAAPLVAVPAAVTPGTPAAEGATIAFESNVVDLGTVTRGEPLTRRVTFANTGSAPLTITKIKASCGCTTVKGWEQTVAPGQQGSFELKLDTAKFMGPVSKTVDVESNASNGTVRLSLKASVWSPVTVHPPMVSFGTSIKGTTVQPRMIEVTVTDPDPLAIAGFTCSNPYFKTAITTVEEGRRYQISVAVPELGTRTQSGELVLELRHPKMNQLKIPVHISPVDALVVQPKLISVSAATLKASPTRSVTIFCHDPAIATLEVTDISYSGGDDVAVSFERQGNNRWGRVLLTFPPGFKPREAKEASLSFRTNHPGYPQVTVPVRFPDASSVASKSPLVKLPVRSPQ
jgi:uncharacterized membrane protein/protein-disulfide isomerase